MNFEPTPSKPASRPRPPFVLALFSATLAAFAAIVAHRLGFWTALGFDRLFGIPPEHFAWVGLVLGALLGLGRFRKLVFVWSGLCLLTYMLVAFTPLVERPIRTWLLAKDPAPADAIVVLSSDVTDEGRLDRVSLERFEKGLELLSQDFSQTFLTTRTKSTLPSGRDDRRRILNYLEKSAEWIEVGPVSSTRDEALQVAGLSERKGWTRVLLVTSPLHMRRAASAFRTAGVPVVPVPAAERGYSLTLRKPSDRLDAFRDWLPEWTGMLYYQLRGWA